MRCHLHTTVIQYLHNFILRMADLRDQLGEAAHYTMGAVFQRHKVAKDNSNHRQMQLTAVVKYGSSNIYNMSGTRKRKGSMLK